MEENPQRKPREKTKARAAFKYEGFSPPYYTMVPDDLFDVIAPNLTEGELRVLLYIIRRTFGFKKSSDAISLDQLTYGIVTREGRRLDFGASVARSAAVRAIKGLIEKDIIVAETATRPQGGDGITTYSLHWKGDATGFFKSTPRSTFEDSSRVTKKNPQETASNNIPKQSKTKTEGKTHEDVLRKYATGEFGHLVKS